MKLSVLSTQGRLLASAALLALASGCCEHAGPPVGVEALPITVDAGPDQTVQVGDIVTLAGTNNGNTGSHKWQFFSTPVDSATSIDDHLVLDGASFVADQVGTYEVELVGATSSNPDAPDVNPAARDTVLITAIQGIAFAPSRTPRVTVVDGRLKLIESATLTDIGPLFPDADDTAEIGQLAYDWTTHTLYGVNVGRDVSNVRLFTIDVCTGRATEVGELRRPDGEAFFLLEGLAIDSAGEIYVSGTLGDVFLRSPTLLTVSTEGGVTTEVVGDMGATIDGIDGGADADRVFATGDGLYISDSAGGTMMPPFDTWLYEVDPSDPSITVDLNPQGISAELSSIAWDPTTDSVEAIDRSSGLWYRVRVEGGFIDRLPVLPAIDGPFAFVERNCPAQGCERTAILSESFDGTFDLANWTERGPFIVPSDVPGGDVGASHITSGGDPGGHLRFGIQGVSVPQGDSTLVWGHLIGDQVVHDPASAGAIGRIDFSFDARLPPGGVGNRAVTLAVEQDGFLWFAVDKRVFIDDLGWTPLTISDLQASDFTSLLNEEPGQPVHPDFSGGGSPIAFGLSQGNHCPTTSNCSLPRNVVEVDIDNWRVEICIGEAGGTLSECGDGILDPGEDCDDANDVRGDGCHRCASEQECIVTHNSGRPASFGSVRVDPALNVSSNVTLTLAQGQDDDDPEDHEENSFGRLASCGAEHAYAVLKDAESIAHLTFDDQGTPQLVGTIDIPGVAAVVCAPAIGVLYAVAASQPGPVLDVYSFMVEEDGSLSEADSFAVTFLGFLNFGFRTARVATHPTTGDLWVTGYFSDAFGGGSRSTTARVRSDANGRLALAEPATDIGAGESGSSFRFNADGRRLAASGVDGDCTVVWSLDADGSLPSSEDQQRACGYLWESGDVAWYRDTDRFHYLLLEELLLGAFGPAGALTSEGGAVNRTRARLMESLYDSNVLITVAQRSGRLSPYAVGEDPTDITAAPYLNIAERGIRSLAKFPCIPPPTSATNSW